MRAVMTSEQYLRHGISGASSRSLVAAGPEPESVTESPLVDERHWGDTLLAALPMSIRTAEQAARISAVYFCASLRAELIGNLPVEVYQGDELAENFSLAEVLSYAPNPLQVGAEFWPAMHYCASLRGYAFAEPVLTATGIEIWPLSPLHTTVEWGARSMKVTYAPPGEQIRVLGPSDVFWIAGLADGGTEPLTPWKMARGSIDFALALENQGRAFFQNGNRPGGVLQSDNELGEEVIIRLKKSMAEWKRGGNAVLEQGLKYEVVQDNNKDSEIVGLIAQRTVEMARYWHIPLSMVDGSIKANPLESENFVKYVGRPIARRTEQAITMRLFTPEMRARGLKVKINLDALLRGDSGTQARNGVLYRTAGTHSINDVRTRVYGLPRINEPWADDVREPLNSNRAADTMTGGETAPHDDTGDDDDA